MSDEVTQILSLQEIDLKIIKLNEKIALIPNEVSELKNLIDLKKQELKDFEDNLKNRLLNKRELERDVEDKKAKIQKLDVQSNSVKTNEEYSALMREIDGLKKGILELEDEILLLMEEEENSDRQIQEFKKDIDASIQKIEGDIKEVEALKKSYEDEKNDLGNKRETLSKELQGSLFKAYEKYFSRKKKVALVDISEDGHCGGCGNLLPLDRRVQAMKGKIVTCDYCSRLLYWDKEKAQEREEKQEA